MRFESRVALRVPNSAGPYILQYIIIGRQCLEGSCMVWDEMTKGKGVVASVVIGACSTEGAEQMQEVERGAASTCHVGRSPSRRKRGLHSRA